MGVKHAQGDWAEPGVPVAGRAEPKIEDWENQSGRGPQSGQFAPLPMIDHLSI